MYRLRYHLKYFKEIWFLVAVLCVIYGIRTGLILYQTRDASILISRNDSPNMMDSLAWFLFYLFPCLLPFNYFGSLLADINMFEYVRRDRRLFYFLRTQTKLISYIVLYSLGSLLILYFTSPNLALWQKGISIFSHICLSLAIFLVIQVIFYIKTKSSVGLVVSFSLLYLSFQQDYSAWLVITRPTVIPSNLWLKLAILIGCWLLLFVIYMRREHL